MGLQEGSRDASALGRHDVDDVVSEVGDREVARLFEALPQGGSKSWVGKSDLCH